MNEYNYPTAARSPEMPKPIYFSTLVYKNPDLHLKEFPIALSTGDCLSFCGATAQPDLDFLTLEVSRSHTVRNTKTHTR